MLLSAEHLSINFGSRQLLEDVNFYLNEGDKVGVIGINGTGKSTFLKVLAGKLEADAGTISRNPNVQVSLLEQNPPMEDDATVLEQVFLHFPKEFRELNEYEAKSMLNKLGLPDYEQKVGTLSGGQRKRVALAAALIHPADVLILDEPTNHLDAESVLWLEQFLKNYQGAVLAVTHDRYFLDNVAEWICEVDRGTLYPYEGNYSTYLETKARRLEMESKQNARRAKKMKSELEWVRSSQKARQAKSKARLAAYEEMEARAARADAKVDYADIHIPVGPRLGTKVLEAKRLHKTFGERVLIDDLSFSLPRNGIVGVIGPNGVGKSTLFKMIVGQEPVSSGSLELGETVSLSYVDQGREGLDGEKSVWEVVSGGNDYIVVGRQEIPSRAYVSAFGFKGTDQQKAAGVLSGGERNRLNLALTLKQGGNLLLLDEPTNDLDTETLEALEEALLEFPGCCVVTSHDRWFMDRICTHILAWEGTDENPGSWHWFEGNFEDYQKDRVARLGAEAARPHRLHRKLTRD